ncbi:transketolase family protein [uncultured Eubacterium sp.]|uniref:transketolase family protein n=1 Tax=uncultured Eubacterium sp. TaxID=165185 RepID=UPI0015A8E7FE|nr:transketolase C-terminal domain-containing protein [uncultured Eubacterium sp.]
MGGMAYTMTDTTKLSTAECYGIALCELGEEHKDVVALTADLAKSTKIGMFGEHFPDRFFNVGIAEQNLFGVAAGMAKNGLIPFASTFAIFTAARSLDQIHTDICYQNVPVKMIATHAGTSFGQAGSTHHALIDMACMRTLPHMTVICPCDGAETYHAVKAAYDIEGPVYIRINRGFDQVIYKNVDDCKFEWDKSTLMNDGTDITVIACGSCVFEAMQAARIAKADGGLSVRVINMHTIKPIDREAVLKAVAETRRIITVEDHEVMGGLGSAVAEVVAESGKGCAFKMLGHQNAFSTIGLQEDLLALAKIDANGIAETIQEMMHADFEADDDWADEF